MQHKFENQDKGFAKKLKVLVQGILTMVHHSFRAIVLRN